MQIGNRRVSELAALLVPLVLVLGACSSEVGAPPAASEEGTEAQLTGALFASFSDVATRTRIYTEGDGDFLTIDIRGESIRVDRDERLHASVTIPLPPASELPFERSFVFSGGSLPGPGEFAGSCSFSVEAPDDYRAWFSFTSQTLQVRILSLEEDVLVGNISMRARQNTGVQSENGILEDVVLPREGKIVLLWKQR